MINFHRRDLIHCSLYVKVSKISVKVEGGSTMEISGREEVSTTSTIAVESSHIAVAHPIPRVMPPPPTPGNEVGVSESNDDTSDNETATLMEGTGEVLNQGNKDTEMPLQDQCPSSRLNKSTRVRSSPDSWSCGTPTKGRSYKEMLEGVKELHKSTDLLTDRLSQLHHNFAEITVNGSLLFNPATLKTLVETAGIDVDKDSQYSKDKKAEVDKRYSALCEKLEGRPAPKRKEDKGPEKAN